MSLFLSFKKYRNYTSIKVDTGAVPAEKKSVEKITEGLDGLQKRLENTILKTLNLQSGEQ